ncbi:AI-2E family transporter [Aliishimia ponticola]|uniref:AI-2E family transporter n=1 Tax=Aliishimia ponticola TaxID=2499833 RepID=A0A4V3XKT0_9RHOB|nr:AI-2E family transporter [Aliishimia ponticola]THH38143.1 AI-2E family transporter [Aliishimia ponticola]
MDRVHWSLIGIFLILAIHMLSWAASFLIPITAALLGFLLVLPTERWLSRKGVPSVVTASVVTIGLGTLITTVILSVSSPVMMLVDDLPQMVRELRADISAMGGETIEKLQEASEAAEEMMDGETDDTPAVAVEERSGLLTQAAQIGPIFVAQFALTLILMFFMISSGSTFLRKLVEVAPDFQDKRAAVVVVDRVSDKLGTYLGGITMINAGLGICIGLAMAFLGLPNPILFGFIAFAFNFIPYLGAMAGASLAALVGYGESGELWSAALVFGTYMTLTSLEGQFLTPYLISGRLRLNPTVVFITVAFFAWLWSVMGMLVAVPILIASKIILDEVPATRAIGLFLGGEDDQIDRSDRAGGATKPS